MLRLVVRGANMCVTCSTRHTHVCMTLYLVIYLQSHIQVDRYRYGYVGGFVSRYKLCHTGPVIASSLQRSLCNLFGMCAPTTNATVLVLGQSTFAHFQLPDLLPFAYVATEVTVSLALYPRYSLCQPAKDALPVCTILWDASLLAYLVLVCGRCDRQQVVYFHVRVAA